MLMAKAESTLNEFVKVIIQGKLEGHAHAGDAFHDVQDRSGSQPAEQAKDQYLRQLGRCDAEGQQDPQLAGVPGLTVTYDAPMKLSAVTAPTSNHLWTTATGVKPPGRTSQRPIRCRRL